MFKREELTKFVIFDLETASNYSSLDELAIANPRMAEIWSKRSEYLRTRFEENKDLSDEELYVQKAALTAEFGRIVCASFGRITFNASGEPTLIVKSYASEDESQIISGIVKVFSSFKTHKFSGHNIKRFDIPFICKRLLINGIELPSTLQIQNLKPWELPYVDTSELWSFGAWQESFSSLDLLTCSLGIPSPKDDIKGSDVGHVFWKESDLTRIAEYCEKDIMATSNVILKLSNQMIVEEYTTQQ